MQKIYHLIIILQYKLHLSFLPDLNYGILMFKEKTL